MNTYFDTPQRNSPEELQAKINIINQSELKDVFVNSYTGLLAVVDEKQQLISINKKYLGMLGIDEAEEILGLRQGEIINCVHAYKPPHGCGTTQFCRTCGLAIAMATNLVENKSIEKYCAIETLNNGKRADLFLKIICEPIYIDRTRFILLYIQDRTKEQQRHMLEQSFLHDFNYMIGGLSMANYQMSRGRCSDELIRSIDSFSRLLIKEVELQSCLLNNNMDYYKKQIHSVSLESVFTDLSHIFHHHPVRNNKTLNFHRGEGKTCINTDGALLLRILSNMITNAFEASEEGGIVDVYWKKEGKFLKFSVHNATFIPEDIQLRIFQRNFSTKDEQGRGIGTYSMKLFGEEFLRGSVGFSSDRNNGTDFFISLPY